MKVTVVNIKTNKYLKYMEMTFECISVWISKQYTHYQRINLHL